MKGRFKRKRFTCNGTGAVRSLTGAYCGVFYGASDKRVRGNAQKLWYIKLDCPLTPNSMVTVRRKPA